MECKIDRKGFTDAIHKPSYFAQNKRKYNATGIGTCTKLGKIRELLKQNRGKTAGTEGSSKKGT